MKTIDGAVHVCSADTSAYPWAPIERARPPKHAAPVESLLGILAEAGVDGAVCIQPAAYGYDHRYLLGALRMAPGQLAGVCLVDPQDPAGPAQLAALAREPGIRGLRLLPYLSSEVPWLAGSTGDPLWAAAAGLRLPVNVLARPEHLDAVVAQARQYPQIPVIIDHLGSMRGEATAGQRRSLLAGGEVANVHVKLSAIDEISSLPFPHDDLHQVLRDLGSAYGPGRLIFGTDWPNGTAYERLPDYAGLLDDLLDLGGDDHQLVFGGTAGRLYFGPAAGGSSSQPPAAGSARPGHGRL